MSIEIPYLKSSLFVPNNFIFFQQITKKSLKINLTIHFMSGMLVIGWCGKLASFIKNPDYFLAKENYVLGDGQMEHLLN